VVVLTAIAGQWWWIWGLFGQEPCFQGKPVRYWRQQLVAPHPITRLGRKLLPTYFPDPVDTLRAGGPAAVPVLVELYQDEDYYVSERAALSLSTIGPKAEPAIPVLIKGLKPRRRLLSASDFDSLASFSFDALINIGPKAIPPLIEALGDDDPAIRGYTAFALAWIGPDAQVINQLKAKSPDGCLNVLYYMIEMDSRSPGSRDIYKVAVPILSDFLKSPERFDRLRAILCLGRIGPQARAAIPPLIELLQDPDDDLRWRAAFAIGYVGPETTEAVPALVSLCRNEKAFVRSHAAESLGQIGQATEEVVGALVTLRPDEDPFVRSQAAESLGQLGQKAGAAIPALQRAAEDPVDWVRSKVSQALKKIEPE
jgi:HEAT repeat protein